MLKQINPEDLVVGQEYYVKLHFNRIDTDGEFPAVFSNNKNSYNFIPINQPIYTLDDQPKPHHPDPELEMLVNVANDIFCASNNPKYTVEDAAVDAYNLIAACKKIKEGER